MRGSSGRGKRRGGSAGRARCAGIAACGSAWILFARLTSPAGAVTTAYWTVEGQEAFLRGRPDGIAVTPEGELVLAPARRPLGDTGQSWVWDLVPGDRGQWWVATGGAGRVLLVREGGASSTVYETPAEESVFAIERAGRDAIYAGVGPGGRLLRLRLPAGSAAADTASRAAEDTLADFDEEYIWDLLLSPAGDLYAATGSPGTIYRLRKGADRPEPWFRTGEEHVLSLAWHPDGTLVAGTGNRGWAFRVEGQDRGWVIYDAAQREIRAIAVLRDGTVALAATGEAEKAVDEEAATAVASPGAGVYRVSASGTVERLWRSPDKAIHCMTAFGDDELLVGTGEKGRIYRVASRPARGAALLFAPEAGQVTALRAHAAGAAVGISQAGSVMLLDAASAASGTYESDVFDAGQISRWGVLGWEGEAAAAGALRIETRSGATAEPGDAWTGWSPASGGEREREIASPPARYLQWRLTLASRDGGSPRVGRVRVALLPPNLSPRIQRLSVSPLDARPREVPAGTPPPQLHQKLPSGVEVQFSLREAEPADHGENAPWAMTYRTADWDAMDPNEDPLRFTLLLRPAEGGDWLTLEEEIEGHAFTWNTASLPDGQYQLLLRATDAPGNPQGTALATELPSAPFVVDHTAPEIVRLDVRREGEAGLTMEGAARDAGSALRGAWASVDGGDWVPLAGEDGMLDEREETFRVRLDAPAAPRHTLAIRVMDEAGNQAAKRAVVR